MKVSREGQLTCVECIVERLHTTTDSAVFVACGTIINVLAGYMMTVTCTETLTTTQTITLNSLDIMQAVVFLVGIRALILAKSRTILTAPLTAGTNEFWWVPSTICRVNSTEGLITVIAYTPR